MRRYETFTLHNVLQRFRTSDCDWLASDSMGAQKQARVSVTDSIKRLELIQEFMFWYFDSFLIPLIRVRAAQSLSLSAFQSSTHPDKLLRHRVIRIPEQSALLPPGRLGHALQAADRAAVHEDLPTPDAA